MTSRGLAVDSLEFRSPAGVPGDGPARHGMCYNFL
jgi:hypothetical protein